MQFIVRKRHLTPREPKPAPKPAPSLLDRIRPSRSPFKRDNDADRDYLETEQERKKRDRSKDRQCLRCGLTFRSTWTGHRTCDPCKAVDARRNPSTLDE